LPPARFRIDEHQKRTHTRLEIDLEGHGRSRRS
jgi:hypothetical protein